MRKLARGLAAAAMIATTVGVTGCAGGDHDPVVARIGTRTLTRHVLTEWMAVLAPEHVVPDPPHYTACVKSQQGQALVPASSTALEAECKQQYQTLERQALTSLISSQWLTGEAAARHVTVSDREVQARVRDDGGAAGANGVEAVAQARARLSAARLAQLAIAGTPRITRTELADYYRQHMGRFERPELRYLVLEENFASAATAASARREVLARGGFAEHSFHELIEGTYIADGRHTTAAARRAIFAAKPHVLGEPIKLNSLYAFFEVTRIVPPSRRSFAQVEHVLRAQLESERRERALERSVGAWRRAWTARTDCAPGYVIQKCKQYRGAVVPENRLVFD